jgi:hypothetical protein
MKKPYLLIAGEKFYPSASTGDWVGCFSTYEEAEAQVKPKKTQRIYHKWMGMEL